LHSLVESPETQSQLYLNCGSRATLVLQALDDLARINPLRNKVSNDPLKAWKQLLATLILSTEFTPGGGGHVRFVVEPGKSDQLAEARGLTAAGHKVRVRIMLHNEE
jgi:hypothetical protein